MNKIVGANQVHFYPNWAGLAVLFSRQLPNGSHDFNHIFSIIFPSNLRINPQTTNALTFLTHIILAIGGVFNNYVDQAWISTDHLSLSTLLLNAP